MGSDCRRLFGVEMKIIKLAPQRRVYPVDVNAGVKPEGGYLLGPEARSYLSAIVMSAKGDYIETGSAFGGSAIVAAQSLYGDSLVYCVDPMWGMHRKTADEQWDIFWKNVNRAGVADKIVLIRQSSNPWPEFLQERKFAVALIDGDHSYAGCKADWLNLKDRVTDFIMFDNIEKPDSVETVWHEACRDKEWELYYRGEHTLRRLSVETFEFGIVKRK